MMSSFTAQSQITPVRRDLPNWQRFLPPALHASRWRVNQNFKWHLSTDNTKEIIIEAGFEFDGASVPWPFTIIFPRAHSQYIQAACLHDWLYITKPLSRRAADKEFYAALRVLGMPRAYAWVMYVTVRGGGWRAWQRK